MRILLCVLSLFVLLSCSTGAEHNESVALNSVPELPPEPMLIRSGSMSFVVDDVTSTRQKVALLTQEIGGYVASEKKYKDPEHPRHEQTVRIPKNRFDEFVAKVEALAKTVDEQDLTSQDVTEDYVDLQSRLTAKKDVETRFREILTQANTIEEIFDVEAKIGAIHSEIEQLEGKMNYLSTKTSYSTIALTYYQPAPPIELPGNGTKFVDSFLDGWNGLVKLLIGITRTWPFLVAIGLAIWMIRKKSVLRVRWK